MFVDQGPESGVGMVFMCSVDNRGVGSASSY